MWLVWSCLVTFSLLVFFDQFDESAHTMQIEVQTDFKVGFMYTALRKWYALGSQWFMYRANDAQTQIADVNKSAIDYSKPFENFFIRSKKECDTRCRNKHGYYVSKSGELKQVTSNNIKLKIKCSCKPSTEFKALVHERYGKGKAYEQYAWSLIGRGRRYRKKLTKIQFKTAEEYAAIQRSKFYGSTYTSPPKSIWTPSTILSHTARASPPKSHSGSSSPSRSNSVSSSVSSTPPRFCSGHGHSAAGGHVHSVPAGHVHSIPAGHVHSVPAGHVHSAPAGHVHAIPGGKNGVPEGMRLVQAKGRTKEEAAANMAAELARLKAENPDADFEVVELTPEQKAEYMKQMKAQGL